MTHADFTRTLVGRPASDHVEITFIQRTHPGCVDYWDGNWVSVRVRIVAGAFHGRTTGDLRTPEVSALREQLARIHETLKGDAALETMEGWLALRLTCDVRGHLAVRGFLMDDIGIGNRLEFAFELDQTDLPAILDGLDEACRRFPVIGAP